MRNVDELVYMFGSFLPSQRAVLLEQAHQAPVEFIAGLRGFLARWARADWLEEYNVERVGEWIALHCPPSVRAEAEQVATSELNSSDANGIRARTYQALADGMARAKHFA